MRGMTKAEDIFDSLVGALDNDGEDWSCAVCDATHDAPSVTGKKVGVVVKLKKKVHTANGGLGVWTFHCIIHEESLCCWSLKMDHVTEDAVKSINLMHARGLNRHQFDNLHNDEGVSRGLPTILK